MCKLINIKDIDIYDEYFEYQVKKRNMTEDEKKEKDLEAKNISDEMLNEKMKKIRNKRDELLAKTDYYFTVPDIKITEERKAQILKYREELRNFPNKIKEDNYYIVYTTPSVDKILESLPKL
jgi:hypothetical protein